MAIKDIFPGITKAALEISRDNGGINAQRSVEDFYADLDKYFIDAAPDHSGLRGTIAAAWQDIDTWLSSLPEDVLQTICTAERDEAIAATTDAPRGTNELLNDIFETV